MPHITVVIAGRHPVLLKGLKSVLEPLDDFRIVATCNDSADLVRAIENLAPNIAIVDNCACNVTELRVIAAIAKSSTELVLLTGAAGKNELHALEATGICRLISKESPPEKLVGFLRRIGAGEKPAVPSANERVVAASSKHETIAKSMEAILTDREREIVELVSEGLSNKAIARRLNVSQGTIKVHLHHIYQKLEINNRTLLAALAVARQ